MSNNRESIISAWKNVEASITVPRRSIEYELEWGSKREVFYDEHGHIPLCERDSKRLLSLKNIFAGERIFIIGNGPSLNKTPLELLENDFTFITNRAYLLLDRVKWRPSFYTALDWRVVPDVAHEINTITGMICFFEERFRGILRNDNDVYWYTHNPAILPTDKLFSYNIDQGVRGAGSVIGACIQIAFFLGFREIYLIGCDLGYKVTETVAQSGEDKFGNGVKIYLTSTKDDDPNHFDPRYFGKGRRWHDPNVKRMISGHQQCLKGVTEGGGRIYNATIGGELEVYPRVDFLSLFPRPKGNIQPRIAINSLLNSIHEISPIPRSADTIIGDFLRCEHAHYDETDVIWHLCASEVGFMVDVGAHRGTSCRPFLESGWRVLAFEPDVNNRTALSNSIDSFLASRKIEIDPRAVGSENKTAAPYFRSDISSGISGLSAFHESHEISGTVDIVTLREAFKKYQYQQIGFLKIDTEGHDLFVLQGYPWEFGKPTVIECEFEDAKTIPLGYSFHELARFLLNKGYTVFVSEWHPIIRYGVRHDWRRMSRYPCELSDQKGWGNLLAFLNPPTAETLTNAVRKVLKSGLGYDASKPIAQQKSQPNRADNTPTKANVTTNNIPNTFESSTFRIELSRHTTQIDRKVWQYSHSPTPQMVWAAINEIGGGTANREFVGSLQLSSDQQMTVRVSLGRHGNTDYEGCHVVADLYPQSPSNIRQKKLFLKDHVALKIQIEVLSHENSDTSLFTVSDLYLNETLSSIRKGLDKDSFSVRHANELFRDGKFESALGIYLAMLNERHLRMYSDNALMAAKKLGFDSASSLSELLKRFS